MADSPRGAYPGHSMLRRSGSALALAIALVCSACSVGGARLKRENAVALAAADARVLQGCHDCLAEARGIYERLSASKYVNRDSMLVRLFETDVLLALRAKELAVDPRPAVERARSLVAILPPDVEAARVLAIVDAVLPDAMGRPPVWLGPFRLERVEFVRKVPGEVAWLATAPVPIRQVVRNYAALALDCSWGGHVLATNTPPGAPHRRPVLLPGSSPLIMYRTGTCLGIDQIMLEAVLAIVPAFHEAAYFAGARAAFTAEEDGGEEATRLLRQAYARFPRVTGLTYMRGWLAQQIGECAPAVGFFDQTLAADSTHELARLDRTVCLSRLRRDTAAIESATRLLSLGGASTRLAYYWRAVSRLRLRELELARGDIERAKTLGRDANVLTLAGLIENDQNDLPVAEKDLRDARALIRGDENCTAIWTLGLVLRKSERPGESAASFEDAMRCYEIRVSDIRYLIGTLRSRPSPNPAFTAKRIASLEADSADARSRYFAAAFNAAGSIANAGNLARALELLDMAARDSSLADPIAQLRGAIAAARDR